LDFYMKTDKRNAQLAPLDVIRVETALSRYPVHRLARQGTVRIELRERNDKGEMMLRWEVSYNSKYGQPGPLAYRVDTLVMNRKLEEAGRPIPRIVRLGSLKEIAQQLDLGGDTNKVKHALYQNAFAAITAKIKYKSADGAERRIEIGDTRYAVVFTGEKLPDGRTADAVYIILHDFYREILGNALIRPLDYDYLRDLPPVPQRWYELASYQVFAAIKHGRGKAKLSYAEFCLYAPQTRYMEYDRVKKQMHKVHAPHRQSGYIAGVEFEATSDREGRADWTMIYTPGPKAKAEYQAFTRKGGPVALEAEPAQPEPELEPTNLERELIDRGVTRGVAAELVRDFSEDRIKTQIEAVDRPRRKIKDKAAYLVSAIREDFATPKAIDPPVKAEPVPVARTTKAVVDAYWRSLSPDERTALDADALAQADPALRSEIEGESRPFMRRLLMSAVRDAHLKSILNVPEVG
jgi:hypothetical protein